MTCGLFQACISIIVLISFGYCMKFDDIIEDGLSEIKNAVEVNLATLEQQLIEESVEIQEWQVRVRILQKYINEVKADRLHVLSRQKRGLRDPRLLMFAGKPGAPGRPGRPGRPGAVGKRGEKGNKGVAGHPGLRGPLGGYGQPGWQGPPGFIGEVGIKGEIGIAGFDGITGLIGDVGFVGYNGEHGRMGPPGVVGHMGFIGMIGNPGTRGDMGNVGISGPPGEKGTLGVPGPVGFYGEPGETGEPGHTGSPGELGYTGKKGEIGIPGENGPWGPVGRPGPVYDPYAAMMAPAPLLTKIEGGLPAENCTDISENVTKCPSSYEKQMAPAIPFNSKSLPALYHPPPGAHVMPAQPGMGKAPLQSGMGKAPMLYGPQAYGKDYSSAFGHSIEYYNEEEKDILTEQEYLDLVKQEQLKSTENVTDIDSIDSPVNDDSNIVHNTGTLNTETEESLEQVNQYADSASEEDDLESSEVTVPKSSEENPEESSEEDEHANSAESSSESMDESKVSDEVNALNTTIISSAMDDQSV